MDAAMAPAARETPVIGEGRIRQFGLLVKRWAIVTSRRLTNAEYMIR